MEIHSIEIEFRLKFSMKHKTKENKREQNKTLQ